MKAIVQERYGSPDVLAFVDVDDPVPGPGELLVRVRAASVNAYDWHVLRGDPLLARVAMPAVFGLRGPKRRIAGRDFAGRVEAVGPGVTRFGPGDAVFGEADGAFAEYVTVSEGVVAALPAGLSFVQAAALPLAGGTALTGLRVAGVGAGQRVLVNGASGGVGTFAVQIGTALGATVTGVCSSRNVDLVRDLGADHVVDYTKEDFARAGREYDVVLDLVGNRSLADLRRALTGTGTLALGGGGTSGGRSVVGPMGLILRATVRARFARHRIRVVTARSSGALLADLAGLVDDGGVTPVIDRTYPLGEVAAAIRHLEVEHARAKVVITV